MKLVCFYGKCILFLGKSAVFLNSKYVNMLKKDKLNVNIGKLEYKYVFTIKNALKYFIWIAKYVFCNVLNVNCP